MSQINKQSIAIILNNIKVPKKNIGIVDAGLISSIIIKDLDLVIILSVDDHNINDINYILKKSKFLLEPLKLNKLNIITTKESKESDKLDNSKKLIEKYRIPNVKKIVIIASGKGGVGKSTLAVNLAVSAYKSNLRVGIIDADINGPSIPHMFGDTTPPLINNNIITPKERFGIKFLSMGNLVNENVATIWRSAMYAKILNQIITRTQWGDLDIIFIDVPPGTGDIHLSLLEKYIIDGVLMVSTPQKLALLDVKKAVNMYKKLHLPILGIVENSLFEVKNINNQSYISEVKKFSNEENINFLGAIPFKEEILKLGDESLSDNSFDFIKNVYKVISNKLLNILKDVT